MNSLTAVRRLSVLSPTEANLTGFESAGVSPLRPPLKWAGGKRWQIPHLRPLWQPLVDAIAEKDDQRFLISLKWQQTGGTAEQKVPFEVISLADVVLRENFVKAYLVLGGERWTLRGHLRQR